MKIKNALLVALLMINFITQVWKNRQWAVQYSLPKYTLNEMFLGKLQEIHDGFEPELWEVNFSRFQFSTEGNFKLVEEFI
jgi:hypothetical protein